MPPQQSTAQESRFQELKRYVGFAEKHAHAVQALGPTMEPRLDSVVDSFYATLRAHPDAWAVFSGPEQVRRLRVTMREWLGGFFAGPYDEAYHRRRARIGRVHVAIGLEPRYMVMAMGGIRADLLAIVRSLEADPSAEDGIARLCDVELAVMLETYHAAYGADLSRRERLAAIGQIAASVSHEIKNPLAVIGSSAYALELVCAKISGHLEPAHAKRVRTHLGRIRRNTERAGTIVTTLLEFLRDRKPVLTLVPWEQVVREGVRDADVPHHVEIELGDDPGAGSVLVDRAQIARVVGNLTRNAVEAMPNEGFIRIDLHADATEVGVSVTDEGPGFSGEILPRAFEPLHTTKAVGTGLGLALCRAIVEAHGGTIEARNLDSRGACVTFRIPRRSAFPA